MQRDSMDWEGSKYVNGVRIPNRPLNQEPVSHTLATQLHRAVFNAFEGLETQIIYAGIGSQGDTNHVYWVKLPKVLSAARMRDLQQFVAGYLACYRSF